MLITDDSCEASPQFINVKCVESHILTLYNLLLNRRYNISNVSPPTLEDHRTFVLNYPYRAWYLIKIHNKFVGTIYLTDNNCIGVNIDTENYMLIVKSLEWILKKYKPLPEIKSIRTLNFHINTAPTNQILIEALKYINANLIQYTFIL